MENCIPEDNEPLVSLHGTSSMVVDEKVISSSFADGDQIVEEYIPISSLIPVQMTSKHGKSHLTTGSTVALAPCALAPLCVVELRLLILHRPGTLMVAGCWVVGLALPEQLGGVESKLSPLFVMCCSQLG